MPSDEDDEAFCVALGRVVRDLRLERGMTQEGLGLDTDVHRNYIGVLEREGGNPSVRHVRRLAIGLGIPVGELLRRVDELHD